MAKLAAFLVLLAMVAIFLALTEVEGGRPFGRHRSRRHRLGGHHHQRDKSHSYRHRRRFVPMPFSFRLPFDLPAFDPYWVSFWETDKWYEGPNVCKEEETETTGVETEENSSFFQQICQVTQNYVRCSSTRAPGKTTTVKYSCCHGYTRDSQDYGCPTEVAMMDLIAKVEDLGLTDFVEVVKKLGLVGELESGNFTLFVPENEAFRMDSDLLDTGNGIILNDSPSVIAVSENSVEQTLQTFEKAILNHVVPGFVREVDMTSGSSLVTVNPEGTKIRILKESRGMLANCVPVLSKNHVATNGVIHTVREILKPVTKSVREIISQQPELNTFKAVMEASGYQLPPNWSGTVWVPTNEAFEEIDKKTRDLIFGSDKTCTENFLRHHIRDTVQCSHSDAPSSFYMYSKDNETYFRSAKTVKTDIMATDGVVHTIDTVFVPHNVFGVLSVLEREGYTLFLGMLEKAGLLDTLTSMSNITIFAPSNEAIQNLPTAVKTKLREDSELLRNVLSYHIALKQPDCKHFYRSELSTLAGQNIRLKTPFGFAGMNAQTAQCASIAKNEESPRPFKQWETCGGQIIIGLTDVMMPPQDKVLDVLAADKKFSKFVSLLKKSGMAEMLQGEGTYTVIAPNNEAFERVDQKRFQRYLENPHQLKVLMKSHIIRDFLCCADMQTPLHFIRTLAGGYLNVNEPEIGQHTVEGASVLRCDQTATNGNVLEVEEVFLPTNRNDGGMDMLNKQEFRRTLLELFDSLKRGTLSGFSQRP